MTRTLSSPMPSRLTTVGIMVFFSALGGCQKSIVEEASLAKQVVATPPSSAALDVAPSTALAPASPAGSSVSPATKTASVVTTTEPERSERPATARKPKPQAEVPATERAPSQTRMITTAPQSGEGYKVYAQVESPVAHGKMATLTVHLEPQSPFKSNDKYPYRFTINESKGVTPSSSSSTGAAVAPDKTTLRVPFRAEQVGTATLGGTFAFSVCTPEKCLIERASLVSTFEVIADSGTPQQKQ